VITWEELQRRSRRPEKEHYYCYWVGRRNLTIDATRKGNLARFMNHSCEPNCEPIRWKVAGAYRIGFFALRDISVGEEITWKYAVMKTPNIKRKACKCKSLSCTGYIDGEPAEEGDTRVSDILLFSY
jgi:histone-lysine N-methyltransferase SETD2